MIMEVTARRNLVKSLNVLNSGIQLVFRFLVKYFEDFFKNQL